MHMFMWLGYNVGEFLFQGLNVVTKSAFAGTCIVLFIVSFLFEGSKVYVATMQRIAARKLYPHRRSDERRNLLWDAPPELREAGPSQNATNVRAVVSPKYRILINLHQTVLYLLHNSLGYCLMMAVMLYNVYLILAVVLGMMAGYFVFGPMLTSLQMECFVKEGSHCTPECDNNAEGTTPPLMHTSLSSESDFFACQTQSCLRPGESTPAIAPQPEASGTKNCYFGAKRCPSKVAIVKRLQHKTEAGGCHRDTERSEDTESHNIEDTMLLRDDTSRHPSTPAAPHTINPADIIATSDTSCCSSNKHILSVHNSADDNGTSSTATGRVEQDEDRDADVSHQEGQEESPQVSHCHNLATSDSCENIL